MEHIHGEHIMTSPAQVKGSGFEREVVDMLQRGGYTARRVPLSGAMAEYKGDVILDLGAFGSFQIECKRRRAGFKTLYSWLGDNDMLVFRDDRSDTLVAMRLWDLMKLLPGGER